MSFLRKLFAKKEENFPDSRDGELITVYDKYGREIEITRKDWRESVLLGNLEQARNNPDELYNLIVSALQDGFIVDVLKPAERLHKIDPNHHRAATILGIIYLNLDRVQEAEQVLTHCIEKFGEEGYLLTNLAKVYSKQNLKEKSLGTLWHSLKLDPNQENAVGWYEIIHREREGNQAGLEALQRISELPGSWRPQLWIARHKLQSGDLSAALKLYEHCLAEAGDPTPSDLLMQLSGDLGNQGHLLHIIELVVPRFDPEVHGVAVINNLLKAYLDLGQIDPGMELLENLQSKQRPDWRENLGYWDAEFNKLRNETCEPMEIKDLKIVMLRIKGPIWLNEDEPPPSIFTVRTSDASRICFLGSSADTAAKADSIRPQMSDNPGRMSRAVPLFLSEHIFLDYDAHTTVIIPWVGSEGGFVLSGPAWKDEDAALYARQTEPPNDYIITTHLVIRGENWRLIAKVIRTIDAKCFAEFDYDFAESQMHPMLPYLLQDVIRVLRLEAGLTDAPHEKLGSLEGNEVDHYLFRVEQTLAVRCHVMDGERAGALSNAVEIVDGIIFLCLQNPTHIPSRMLLLRVLKGLKKKHPELVASFQGKVENLQKEHPISVSIDNHLSEKLRAAFAG